MIPMLTPMASHDQKGHVASHLSHFDPRNEMMPLMMQFALGSGDVNGIT